MTGIAATIGARAAATTGATATGLTGTIPTVAIAGMDIITGTITARRPQ